MEMHDLWLVNTSLQNVITSANKNDKETKQKQTEC